MEALIHTQREAPLLASFVGNFVFIDIAGGNVKLLEHEVSLWTQTVSLKSYSTVLVCKLTYINSPSCVAMDTPEHDTVSVSIAARPFGP